MVPMVPHDFPQGFLMVPMVPRQVPYVSGFPRVCLWFQWFRQGFPTPGTTPLGFACLLGREPLVELLLGHHADPRIQNNRGHSVPWRGRWGHGDWLEVEGWVNGLVDSLVNG